MVLADDRLLQKERKMYLQLKQNKEYEDREIYGQSKQSSFSTASGAYGYPLEAITQIQAVQRGRTLRKALAAKLFVTETQLFEEWQTCLETRKEEAIKAVSENPADPNTRDKFDPLGVMTHGKKQQRIAADVTGKNTSNPPVACNCRPFLRDRLC